MDLHKYYRENKNEINSSIMEIASDLAVARLMNEHGRPFETFVEPDDPDDPEGDTHYKEEYQDKYDKLYDEEYERLAALMHFDLGSEDGVAHEAIDSKATETKSAYVTVRFDIESVTDAAITEEDIDDLIGNTHFPPQLVGDHYTTFTICGRHEQGS